MTKSEKPPPVCPSCGRNAVIKYTQYGDRAMCCDLVSWNYKPLVSKQTLKARQDAHAAFDPLWKNGPDKIMGRSRAYARLGSEMGLSKNECHISLMDEKTALLVPEAVNRIRNGGVK